ncbi:MAG: DUF3598 family protein [Microcoleaceae cyanobacterium]
MGSQWENFLNNLGEWHGSFTQFSPTGELVKHTPSILCLEGLDQNKSLKLTLRRFPEGDLPSNDTTTKPPVDELVRQYQALGKDILFFDNGAFCQGTIQIAPLSQSGAEFGFIEADRRLRLVELFDPDGNLKSLTLIREQRAGTQAAESPMLTVEQLLGIWEGEATTIYPDQRSPETYRTQMQLHRVGTQRLHQKLTFDSQTLESEAKILSGSQGEILKFQTGNYQVIFLPGGASATVPKKVQLRTAYLFEAGWLVHPQERQRLIRQFNDKGEWESVTLVKEKKVDS